VEGEEEEAEQPRAISPPPQQPPQPPQQQPQPQPQQEQGRAALGKKAQARLDAQARVEAGGRRRKQAPPPPPAAAAAGRGGSPDGDGEHGESGGPSLWDEVEGLYTESASLRRSVGMALLSVVGFGAIRFVPHSFSIARRISEPRIMAQGAARFLSLKRDLSAFRSRTSWCGRGTTTGRTPCTTTFARPIGGCATRRRVTLA